VSKESWANARHVSLVSEFSEVGLVSAEVDFLLSLGPAAIPVGGSRAVTLRVFLRERKKRSKGRKTLPVELAVHHVDGLERAGVGKDGRDEEHLLARGREKRLLEYLAQKRKV
jgi:hypothetical protein